MKIKNLLLLLLTSLNIFSQNITNEDIINERERIESKKNNYFRIEFYNLDEFNEYVDYPVLVYSKRTYYFDENNELVYISTEDDHQIGTPPRHISKGLEEFFLKDNKLINYRKLNFNQIPFTKESPLPISTVINLDSIQQYVFSDDTLLVKELSYFFNDSACIKIDQKEITTKLNNYKKVLKRSSSKELQLGAYGRLLIERYGIEKWLAPKGKLYQEKLEILRKYLEEHRSEGVEKK